MNNQSYRFEGLDNFRDFGGYAVADGRRIKRGRLFRSAHLHRATDPDLEKLRQLRIEAIVDLRLPVERLAQPTRHSPRLSNQLIASDKGQPHGRSGWTQFVHRPGGFAAAEMREWMRQWYRTAPFEDQHIELFSRYLASLPEASGPVLIHCAAGKDRTGLLAALTHHLLGVASEHIEHDYLLTNNEAVASRFLPILRQSIVQASGRTPDPEALRASIWIEAEYLQASFNSITERFGSIGAYLDESLGVGANQQAAIRECLLE